NSQSWNLDALGNWSSVTADGTTQTRTHNQQNEVTSAGGVGLTFDGDGNTTQDETGQKLAYDAWNRLVRVSTASGATLADYGYDLLGERITESHGDATTDLYYSDQWQVLEERQGGVAVV